MMYLYPELVDMDSYEGSAPHRNPYPEFTDYAPFTEKTSNGCIGFADHAAPEKGKEIIDACVGKMMEYLKAREMV